MRLLGLLRYGYEFRFVFVCNFVNFCHFPFVGE